MKFSTMNVLLIDVDSKIPNLALMKLSTYYKHEGEHVYLNKMKHSPDIVYMSCIFSKNKPKALGIAKMFNCPVIQGGYGLNDVKLPNHIEHLMPDYSLYNTDFSMGFTSRGCIRRCPWCIVWQHEGQIRDHAPVSEFWDPAHHKLILLDNNFLASPRWREKLQFIIDHKLQVNFNQALDIRTVDEEKAALLSQTRAMTRTFKTKMIHFAWDDPAALSTEEVLQGIQLLKEHGIHPRYMTFYILCGFNTTHEQDLQRFKILQEQQVTPYVMKYNDTQRDPWLNIFDRWVNRHLYKVCKLEDYTRKKI